MTSESIEPLDYEVFKEHMKQMSRYYTAISNVRDILPWEFMKSLLNDYEFQLLMTEGFFKFIEPVREILTTNLKAIRVISRQVSWIHSFQNVIGMFTKEAQTVWNILGSNRTVYLLLTNQSENEWKFSHCVTIEDCNDEYNDIKNRILDYRIYKNQEQERELNSRLIRETLKSVLVQLKDRVPLIETTITVDLTSNKHYRLYKDFVSFKETDKCSERLYSWAKRISLLEKSTKKRLGIIQESLEGDCAICSDSFNVFTNKINILSCGHCYHADCGITRWLDANHNCPMCRCSDPVNTLMEESTKELLVFNPETGVFGDGVDEVILRILDSRTPGRNIDGTSSSVPVRVEGDAEADAVTDVVNEREGILKNVFKCLSRVFAI
jgi:hypothetical protein